MKILIVTPLFPPFHSGTHDLRCHRTSSVLKQRGHTVHILTSSHGLGSPIADLECSRTLQLNGVHGAPSITAYRELHALEKGNTAAFRDALARFEPDLILFNSLHGLSKSLLGAARHSRVPFTLEVADLWLPHELRRDPWLRWWNDPASNPARSALEWTRQRNRIDAEAPTRLDLGLDRLPDLFTEPDPEPPGHYAEVRSVRLQQLFFRSEYLRQETLAAGFRVNHADLIPPGFALERWLADPRPEEPPPRRILIATPLDADSGIPSVLEALKAFRNPRSGPMLSIVGKGDADLIPRIRSQIIQTGLSVEFPPVSDPNQDFPALFKRHDVFLYPRLDSEPFPEWVVEAMAAGLPVLGSRTSATHHLLRHGENSLTFAPGDAAELGLRITELTTNPGLRRAIAETAQAEVLRDYNESLSLDRLEEHLSTTLQQWNQG